MSFCFTPTDNYQLPICKSMYLTRNALQELPTFKLKLPYVGEKKGSYQVNKSLPGFPKMPLSLQLRGYQRQAVTSWFANHGRGTLKIATGSGKTITALAIACELYQQIGLQVLLVVCPYRHLVPSGVENVRNLTYSRF
jgi:superfamily II DNA or RNA helicase